MGFGMEWSLRGGFIGQTHGVPKASKRRRRQTLIWWLGGGGAFIALALLIWFGVSWIGTYRQAQLVQGDVAALRSSLAERSWQAIPNQVRTVEASAEVLVEQTGGAPWRLLSAFPIVGSSAQALGDLARGLAGVTQAADPLTPFAERLIDGEIRLPDGRFDLEAMQEVAPLLDRLADRMESAVERLDAVDTDAIRPEIGGPLAQFRTEIADALPAVTAAADVATWMPGMLGADGPRTWAVLLQNPSEARGSGGFIGGYVLVSARDGEVSLTSSGTSSELAREPIPANSAPEDARVMWGDILERWGAFNVSPHYPMTAALAADGLAAMGMPVDGVIAVDPQAVASMLQITGPVTARGETITADDAAQFFTVDVYAKYPDGQERDEVSMALVEATVEALLAADWDPFVLAEALQVSVEQERVLVWSANVDEQGWLEQTVLGGVLPNQPGSVVAVAFNNSAANKTDAFVTAFVDYRPGRCVTASPQKSSLQVKLRNDAPAKLPRKNYGYFVDPTAPRGTTRMLVHVYAPVGANYQSAQVDGVDTPLYLGSERNRPVWWTYLELRRNQERVLDVTFEEPTVLGVEPRVIPQPMVNREVSEVAPDPAC